MKNLYKMILLILGISLMNTAYAQWTQTELSGGFTGNVMSHNGNLYAATAGGVYKSTNNGDSWVYSSSNIYNETGSIDLSSAMMASNGSALFIVSGDVILRSTDNGDTWNDFMTGIPSGADIRTIYTSKNIVYVWLNDAGYKLYKLVGSTWTFEASSVITGSFYAIDTFVYRVSASGILRASDGFSFLTYTTTGLASNNISAMAGNATRVFAIVDDTTIYSSSNGGNWSIKMGGLANVQSLQGLAMVNNVLFVTVLEKDFGLSIYKSTDFGLNWVGSNTSAVPSFNYFLNYTVTAGGRIVAASPVGIFSTDDNGTTWVSKNVGLKAGFITSVVSTANNTVLASDGYTGVFASVDGGATWVRGNGLPAGYVTFLGSFETQSNVVFTIVNDYADAYAGLYVSADGGMNWAKMLLPSLMGEVNGVVGVSGSTTFFTAVDTNMVDLLVKSDNGVVFADITSTLPVGVDVDDVDGISGNGTTVYMWVNDGTGKGVYVSSNAGLSWSGDIDGLSSDPAFETQAVFYAGSELFLYADTTNGGEYALYHKIGPDWVRIQTSGLSNESYLFTAYSGTIYAFDGDSVHYSMDMGATWSSYSNSGFVAGTSKNNIAINSSGIYMATNGNGVWKSNLSVGISSLKTNHMEVSNYPNPVEDRVTFSYTLTQESYVKIELFDYTGRIVKTFLNSKQMASNYSEQFFVDDLPEGAYTYRISTSEGVGSGRLIKM